MPSDAATRGTLVVHLRSASNLRSADRGGTSDPYVKLKIDATEHKSKAIDKSLNPTWDERFEFPGTLGALRDATLVLAVQDKDGLSFDDALGGASVPLSALCAGYAEELTLSLEGKKATGEVRIALAWVDAEEGAAAVAPLRAARRSRACGVAAARICRGRSSARSARTPSEGRRSQT